MRLQLNGINTNLTTERDALYSALNNIHSKDKNENEKLKEMEQEVLDYYYDIRTKEGIFDRQHGDVVERFITSPNMLNLSQKYDVKVLHSVDDPRQTPALNLYEEIPLRIAKVAIEDLFENFLIINGNANSEEINRSSFKINTEFLEKLKNEYDEVVVFSKNACIQNYYSELLKEWKNPRANYSRASLFSSVKNINLDSSNNITIEVHEGLHNKNIDILKFQRQKSQLNAALTRLKNEGFRIHYANQSHEQIAMNMQNLYPGRNIELSHEHPGDTKQIINALKKYDTMRFSEEIACAVFIIQFSVAG